MDLVLVMLGSLILVATGIVEPQSKKTDELAEAPSSHVSTPEPAKEPELEPEPGRTRTRTRTRTC